MKNNYCILCVKDYLKIMEYKNIVSCNFRKYIEHVKLLLVKHNLIFGAGYYHRNNIFPLTDLLFSTSF